MAGTFAGGVTAVRISIFVSDAFPAWMAFLEDLGIGSSAIRTIVDGRRVRFAGWIHRAATDWLSGGADWALAFVWCCRADGTTSLNNALLFAYFLWFGSCASAVALVDGLGIEAALVWECRAADLK